MVCVCAKDRTCEMIEGVCVYVCVCVWCYEQNERWWEGGVRGVSVRVIRGDRQNRTEVSMVEEEGTASVDTDRRE